MNRINQKLKTRQKEEVMAFAGSLKHQTALKKLQEFPQGFAMSSTEEMVVCLKTDDSKNKSTQLASEFTPQSKVTSHEKVARAIPNPTLAISV